MGKDWLIARPELLSALLLLKAADWLSGLGTGAFGDQLPGSKALDNIGPTPVASHAIACTSEYKDLDLTYSVRLGLIWSLSPPGAIGDVFRHLTQPNDGEVLQYLSSIRSTPLQSDSPDAAADRIRVPDVAKVRLRDATFGHQPHDNVVRLESSHGGLSGDFVSIMPNALHGYAPKYASVQRRVRGVPSGLAISSSIPVASLDTLRAGGAPKNTDGPDLATTLATLPTLREPVKAPAPPAPPAQPRPPSIYDGGVIYPEMIPVPTVVSRKETGSRTGIAGPVPARAAPKTTSDVSAGRPTAQVPDVIQPIGTPTSSAQPINTRRPPTDQVPDVVSATRRPPIDQVPEIVARAQQPTAPVAQPSSVAADKFTGWTGTWLGMSDRLVYTLQGGNGILSGSYNVNLPGTYYANGRGNGSFSSCTVKRSRHDCPSCDEEEAVCAWTGNYQADNVPLTNYTGIAKLSRTRNTLVVGFYTLQDRKENFLTRHDLTRPK